MSVKLLSNAINILVGLLKGAVASREAALEYHGNASGVLLKEQRREYEIARKKLEMKQADRAIVLHKSLAEAKAALRDISQ
jgi:hypothetical protein